MYMSSSVAFLIKNIVYERRSNVGLNVTAVVHPFIILISADMCIVYNFLIISKAHVSFLSFEIINLQAKTLKYVWEIIKDIHVRA